MGGAPVQEVCADCRGSLRLFWTRALHLQAVERVGMPEATVRFYAELNDRLPPGRRFAGLAARFEGVLRTGDLIQSFGVPAGDIDLVLLNGSPVSLDACVSDGDRLSVYPVFESLDITQDQRIRETPLRVVRFVLDVHLGKLASHLRMAGFDAMYRSDYSDRALMEIAREERRLLLSRDRRLIDESSLDRAYRVRSENPEEQLAEVLERFQLQRMLRPFTRCLLCNCLLAVADPDRIQDRVPPGVRETQTVFRRCPSCGRVYWPGTHVGRMTALMERVLGRESPCTPGALPKVDFE